MWPVTGFRTAQLQITVHDFGYFSARGEKPLGNQTKQCYDLPELVKVHSGFSTENKS